MGLALPRRLSPIGPLPEAPAEVHALPLNSWEQIASGLESDEINAAFINIPLAMDLFDRGLDIALLMFTHRGGSRMTCSPGVKRIPDFKGKSVLIPHLLSVQHMLLYRFLDARGMVLEKSWSPETVCAEPVPPFLMPEMTSKDQAGDIAGFICEAPFGTRAVEQGQARHLLASRDLWPDHPCSAFVVRRALLESHPKIIENLVLSFFRCAALLDTDTGKAKKEDDVLMAQASNFLKLPEKIIAGVLESSGVTYAPELLVPDAALLDIIQQYMGRTMGLLSGTINLEDFIMPAFARKALGELDI